MCILRGSEGVRGNEKLKGNISVFTLDMDIAFYGTRVREKGGIFAHARAAAAACSLTACKAKQ